jgi:hypothetical protein
MAALYQRHRPLASVIAGILRVTLRHATRLALFVTLYQSLHSVQGSRHGSRRAGLAAAVGGAIGGWLVFGGDDPVSRQIVLYLVGRNIAALLSGAPEQALLSTVSSVSDATGFSAAVSTTSSTFPALGRLANALDLQTALTSRALGASLTWALVMYLHTTEPERLARSLSVSMDYLYLESQSFDSLRNWFWVSK